MAITIIPNDNMVIIDGGHYRTDLSALLSQNIRAVQWDGSAGWVEYYPTPNRPITDLSEFQAVFGALKVPTPQSPSAQDKLSAFLAANPDVAAIVSIPALEKPPSV